jgi:hypothetical protein
MGSRLYFRWMWFWCWACYRAYLALPAASSHNTRYGRALMWLLGYAGAYAHSDPSNFHLCSFFYRTDAEQSAAWDRHLSAMSQADQGNPNAT